MIDVGKNVMLRDVHNMVSKMKEKRKRGATVEERLETVLRGVCESRGNRASVFIDDAKITQTITLQTRQMRRWFKAFPEVMLVDATHNTNESRYKLFSFMVNDVYGHVSIGTFRYSLSDSCTRCSFEVPPVTQVSCLSTGVTL